MSSTAGRCRGMIADLPPCLDDPSELVGHRLRIRDPKVTFRASQSPCLRLFLRVLCRPLVPDVEHVLHAWTDDAVLAVRSALAG